MVGIIPQTVGPVSGAMYYNALNLHALRLGQVAVPLKIPALMIDGKLTQIDSTMRDAFLDDTAGGDFSQISDQQKLMFLHMHLIQQMMANRMRPLPRAAEPAELTKILQGKPLIDVNDYRTIPK